MRAPRKEESHEDEHVYGELTGNMTRRIGVAILEGTEDQIRALHAGEEFRNYLNRAAICVDHVNVTLLESGDAMTTRLQRYGKNVKEVLG